MCKSLSGLLHLTVCMFLFVAHVLASGLHSGWVRKRSELSGKQPTFALSLIFWPNTKDIATSASFFSLPPPSLLPLAPSSSFSCFWNGNPNVNFRFVVVVSFNRSSATPCTPVILFYNIYVTFYECLTQNTSLQKGHETTDFLRFNHSSPVICPWWLSALCCSGRGTGPQVSHLMTFSHHWFHNWNLDEQTERTKIIYCFFPQYAKASLVCESHAEKHAMQDINVQS